MIESRILTIERWPVGVAIRCRAGRDVRAYQTHQETPMQLPSSGTHDWKEKLILVPRLGKFLTRDGIHTRLILPGRYLVRKSRTMRSWLYRKRG